MAANKYAGTQTEKNLQEAFAGESQARNKYTYFASVAKKEGYEQMSALFLKTADNEKEHAKMWFKELHGGSVPSTEESVEELMKKYISQGVDKKEAMKLVAKEKGITKSKELEIAGLLANILSVDEATIDFYDENGNWDDDCSLTYGSIAGKLVRKQEYHCEVEQVTRDQYEAALAASSGWIEWCGGECPVDSDAIGDVKYRKPSP